MIGTQRSFKNQKISITTPEYRIGVSALNWKTIDSSDSQADIQGSHGIKVSPTFMRGRRITIEGVIIAESRENTSRAMDYLDRLFVLQGEVDKAELFPFLITDEQGRERSIDAKIKEPIEYQLADDDYMEGTTRVWRVSLQAPDARFFSLIEQKVIGSEGYYGGLKLGTKLGAKMNLKYNEILCSANSAMPTPARFIIKPTKIINAPLTIKKNHTGEHFSLDIDAKVGDVIVIDSKKKTATKNGVNILATRVSGSTRLTISEETIFTIFDKDGGLYESDFDVEIYFRNILI